MRSRGELVFRTRQEFGNLGSYVRPPKLPAGFPALLPAGLPDPEPVLPRLRGTTFAREVEELAGSVLQHRFALLGVEFETGATVNWRRDYVHGRETNPVYFRRIPYLDADCAGDHKVIWELNRHQHLVLLAQAFRLTGRDEFAREIAAQLESWLEQNPYLRGINWASALEVAFRALSWIWILHLAGRRIEPRLRSRLLEMLWLHGRYLERNLSIYFSPNTHLLGEAVALHALGTLFPQLPRAAQWESTGARQVREQMDFQVRDDGSHFEQSTYYHVYALDFFLFHALLSPPPDAFNRKLERMADYLAAVLRPCGSLPFLGDDDGGRLFHPFGPRDSFGRTTLATAALYLDRPDWPCRPEDVRPQAAWWMGDRALRPARTATVPATPRPASQLFPGAGLAVMEAGGLRVLVDAGPLAQGGAGHSHADTLSLVACCGSRELLIDPGTYTYTADPYWREWFRGSAAHNTVTVSGIPQAKPAGPFRWAAKPSVQIICWDPQRRFLDAVCRYGRIAHRRKVLLSAAGILVVLDEVTGPPGPAVVEQFWHTGAGAVAVADSAFRIGNATLAVAAGGGCRLYEGEPHGWRSRVYGRKEPAPVIHLTRTSFPARFATVLSIPVFDVAPVQLRVCAAAVEVLAGDRRIAIFPAEGLPE